MQEVGLRSLADAGRAQQKQAPGMDGRSGGQTGGGGSLQPRCPIRVVRHIHTAQRADSRGSAQPDDAFVQEYAEASANVRREGVMPITVRGEDFNRQRFRLEAEELRRETRTASAKSRKVPHKTKRPRLKESWDARPNSPPPSAAQEGDYPESSWVGMARTGYMVESGPVINDFGSSRTGTARKPLE